MAKRVYDIESLLQDIEDILKADLNTAIGDINGEEADGIDLKTIDSNAYFLQELSSKTANFNPFLLYGCSEMETIQNGPEAAARIMIEIIIIFEDTNGNEANIPKLAFRYNRALRDVMRNNWQQKTDAGKLYMEDLLPIPYTKLNSSNKSRATGIKITTSIA